MCVSVSVSSPDGSGEMPGSIDDYLEYADVCIGDHHYAGYDKLAAGLRLIAEVVDRMMISSPEELEQTLNVLMGAWSRIDERVRYDLYREKYGPGEEGLLSLIRGWDRQDVYQLKELLDDALRNPEFSSKTFWEVRNEIAPIYTRGVCQDSIDHPTVMASDKLIAVDASGRALIAMEGTGPAESYSVKIWGEWSL